MLLHMLRWVVGDDNFFSGIKNYLNDPKLQHGFARTSDFKAHMESVSGRDLTEFFADWFTGQGFPQYTIQVGQSPDLITTVTIYQGQSHSSVSFFEMPVPVQLIGESKDTLVVFNHTFSGEAYLVNPGFVIKAVIFDPDLWLLSKNNSISLGINDLPKGKKLILVPNPASDFLLIQHNLGKINSMEIMTLDGKSDPIEFNNTGDTEQKINIQHLKAGTYLLRIGYKESAITRKFIITR
jgi:hypothetical protein